MVQAQPAPARAAASCTRWPGWIPCGLLVVAAWLNARESALRIGAGVIQELSKIEAAKHGMKPAPAPEAGRESWDEAAATAAKRDGSSVL